MGADADVVIVGAGLAGLSAARYLHRAQVPTMVCEAADDIGGRVRTDGKDGFLLDRGFQAVVIATDGTSAAALAPGVAAPRWHRVTTFYYRLPASPLSTPVLAVDGRDELLLLRAEQTPRAAETGSPNGQRIRACLSRGYP